MTAGESRDAKVSIRVVAPGHAVRATNGRRESGAQSNTAGTPTLLRHWLVVRERAPAVFLRRPEPRRAGGDEPDRPVVTAAAPDGGAWRVS